MAGPLLDCLFLLSFPILWPILIYMYGRTLGFRAIGRNIQRWHNLIKWIFILWSDTYDLIKQLFDLKIDIDYWLYGPRCQSTGMLCFSFFSRLNIPPSPSPWTSLIPNKIRCERTETNFSQHASSYTQNHTGTLLGNQASDRWSKKEDPAECMMIQTTNKTNAALNNDLWCRILFHTIYCILRGSNCSKSTL